jgi:mannosyltransferase OCH1-like enzyme
LWDTKRFDINSVLWVKQVFETGLYSCAADYIRLYAVYNCGIYLDMDMELVKPFDALLNAELMLGCIGGATDLQIQAACFGAAKGHLYIKNVWSIMNKRRFSMRNNFRQ